MYNGQVNVSQDRLQTFLAAAELLQIKGLTDVNDKDEPAKVKDMECHPKTQVQFLTVTYNHFRNGLLILLEIQH